MQRSFFRGWLLSRALHALNPERNVSCHNNSQSLPRALHTSSPYRHLLDARDKDIENKEKQLTRTKGRVFDEAAKQEDKNKETFRKAIKKYTTLHDKYGRGNVEFMYAALSRIKEFSAHKDKEVYKEILSIFPKHKMVARTMWQSEMMHYPKQQQCAIDILDKMESNGVVPDDEMGYLLRDIFGDESFAFRKYRRMMYWMPRFKNLSPYPVPVELPVDPRELARLALQRMAVDLQSKLEDFHTSEIKDEDVFDETFVVSAQSPDQRDLVSALDPQEPVFVEGGFTVWLRDKSVTYFVLQGSTTATYKSYKQHEEKQEETDTTADFLKDIPFFSARAKKPTAVQCVPTVHEQEDGTVLAMCVTGTASKNSLAAWVRWLQQSNPHLANVPVVFRLRTPETGLQVVKGESEHMSELAQV